MLRASIAGRVRAWYGDVGDFVEPDEIIVEIETADGTQVEVAAPVAGRITEIHTLVGDAVESGTVLAHIDEMPAPLHELLDGSQKPKRKQHRKYAAVAPSRHNIYTILGLFLLVLGVVIAAAYSIVWWTWENIETPISVVTPVSRFTPDRYAILREPVGDLPGGSTVLVQSAFYDGQMWQYTVASNGITVQVPESLLDGAPVPAPTPTMIYDYRQWAWSNPLVLMETVADFPAGTRVRITSATFDGLDWQLDVLTDSGFNLKVRESQLAFPSDPPANPMVTPTAAFLSSDIWEGYQLITREQVGDIPANTLVRVISARYGFDGWIYTVISKGDPTGVEALESQLDYAASS